jgi:hypothetical protein
MRVDSSSSTSPIPAGSDTASTNVAGLSRSRSFDLIVTTKDGDTVKISSSTTSTIGAARSIGADGTEKTAVVGESSSAVSVQVTGTLDRDELVDLKKTLKALEHAGHGRHAGWLERRLSRPDLGSLASISASGRQSVAIIGGTLVLSNPTTTTPASTDSPSTTPAADATTSTATEPQSAEPSTAITSDVAVSGVTTNEPAPAAA